MNLLDPVRKHLQSGNAAESIRRHELLAALLRAFGQGGSEAVTAEIARRLDEQEQEFGRRLHALQDKQ